MKLAVPNFLKSKGKTANPAKAAAAERPQPAAKPPVVKPLVAVGRAGGNGKTEQLPGQRYMRRREVIRHLGITAYEFRKWIEAGLLTPHRRPAPDPHRLSGKNRPRGQRALFLLSEVEAVRLENLSSGKR